MTRAAKLWPVLALALALLAAAAPEIRGHTGRRLRLGYRSDNPLPALAAMTKVYLEEISGFTVELREFPDAEALRKAVRSRAVDLAVERPTAAWGASSPADGSRNSTPLEKVQRSVRDAYDAVWVAAFGPHGEEYVRPTFILTVEVADDIAYYTLPDYLRKLAEGIGDADIEALFRLDPAGRSAPALRSILAARKLI